MGKDFLSQRVRAESERIIDKQRITETVHQYFSRFGNRMVDAILPYALQENGLRTLCNKLHISPTQEKEKLIGNYMDGCLSSYVSQDPKL